MTQIIYLPTFNLIIMNKRFLNALLFGAVVLSTGTFTSCNNDDVDDLKSRVSVIEVAIDDIKTQLGKALMTGER